jgi:hypothetical protein
MPTDDLGDTTASLIDLVHQKSQDHKLSPEAMLAIAHNLIPQTNIQAGVNVEQPRRPVSEVHADIVPTKTGGHRLQSHDASLWHEAFPATDDNVSATLKCPAHQKLRPGEPTMLQRFRHATLNKAYDVGLFENR